MGQVSYSIGRAVGRKRIYVVAGVALVLAVSMYMEHVSLAKKQEAELKQRVATAAKQAQQKAALEAECRSDGNAVKSASVEFATGNAQRAADALQKCANNLEDPTVKALYVKVNTLARERHAAAAARIVAAEKAEKKKHGVTLGMTRQDVLDSRWGKPEHINRTTTRGGIHEQWVYSGGNYLYFEDGVLTAIQN